MTVDCPTCGDGFDSERGMKSHHTQAHGESIAGVEATCDNCGAVTRKRRCNLEANGSTFCGYECYHQFRGRSAAATVQCSQCGTELERNSGDLKYSERHFCDRECRGQWESENLHGPDSPHWRGGKSLYDAVKRSLGDASLGTYLRRARERGDGTCEKCGGDNGGDELHVHHIVPILVGGTHHLDNLMLLCHSCHNTVEAYTDRLFDKVIEP